MARVTRSRYVDDVTGKEIEEGRGGPVEFSLKGDYFEVDLSEESQAELDQALAPYVENATEVPPRRRRAPARAAAGTRRSSSQRPQTDKEHLQAMRAWLRAQGHQVGDRGRIAQNLQDLYNAAH